MSPCVTGQVGDIVTPTSFNFNDRRFVARNLAAQLLAGAWEATRVEAAIITVLGPLPHKERRALAARVLRFGTDGAYPPAPEQLTGFLLECEDFKPKRRSPVVLAAPCFVPTPPFAGLAIPKLATRGELGDWLGLSGAALDWMADERRGHQRAARTALQNYRYEILVKPRGGARLLEAPKPRLKAIQLRILHEILDAVPVHEAAHGFVAGRSALSGAQLHAGEAVVARFDLQQFFPSIGAARVHGMFRSLGYPWAVARTLTGVCTTVTPQAVLRGHAGWAELYGAPHLPQGAPSSPALANLLAFGLDVRLSGLARAVGAQYSRYADDLAFSGGDVARPRVAAAVARIVREEGFALNEGKTRLMPAHQRQMVTGIVVNATCNVSRAEFDALKAVLTNCVRHGPGGQNRGNVTDFRAHLAGRVAWVAQVNPGRGPRLWALFDAVDWGGVTVGCAA